jgi:hypothetical protein
MKRKVVAKRGHMSPFPPLSPCVLVSVLLCWFGEGGVCTCADLVVEDVFVSVD